MANKRLYTLSYSSDNEDSFSAYSEDFEKDSRPPTPDHKRRYNAGRKRFDDHTSFDSETSSSTFATTSYRGKKSSQSEKQRRTYTKAVSGVRKGWRSTTYSKDRKRSRPPGKPDQVYERMLSAQRNRINILNDEMGEKQMTMEELIKENRLLKNLQHRQDKALRKFENRDGELPKLINQHMDDERVLKARLRKAQEAERRLEGRLKDTNEELQKMENTLRKLKKIVYDKNLGERSELAKQLNTAEEKLQETEKKNKELEKRVDLTTQSFNRQINAERAKHRVTKQILETLQEEHRVAEAKLKEKERALEKSNIYSLRSKQSPEKSFVSSARTASPRRTNEKPSAQTAVPPLQLGSKPKKEISSENLYRQENSALVQGELVSNTFPTYNSPVKLDMETTKSPAEIFRKERENSALLDLKSSHSTEIISNGKKELHLDKEKDEKNKKDKPAEFLSNRSVFLTAGRGSPSSTLVSEGVPSVPSFHSPPDSLNRYSPKQDKVVEEPKKTQQQMQEERKKAEEEKRKKAALLAKIKDLEEDTAISDASKKSDKDDFQKLLSNETNVPVPRAGMKSIGKQVKRDFSNGDFGKTSPETSEPELTFGGYAPTVTAAPRRKPRTQPKKKFSPPPGSESDEPLLDVASGKAKKPDLLQQLFGEQAAKPTSTSNNLPNKMENPLTSSSREASMMITTPRAKPVHSGYPWEQNVLQASRQATGDGFATKNKTNEILTGPVVKALPAFNDDDIEEVIL